MIAARALHHVAAALLEREGHLGGLLVLERARAHSPYDRIPLPREPRHEPIEELRRRRGRGVSPHLGARRAGPREEARRADAEHLVERRWDERRRGDRQHGHLARSARGLRSNVKRVGRREAHAHVGVGVASVVARDLGARAVGHREVEVADALAPHGHEAEALRPRHRRVEAVGAALAEEGRPSISHGPRAALSERVGHAVGPRRELARRRGQRAREHRHRLPRRGARHHGERGERDRRGLRAHRSRSAVSSG